MTFRLSPALNSSFLWFEQLENSYNVKIERKLKLARAVRHSLSPHGILVLLSKTHFYQCSLRFNNRTPNSIDVLWMWHFQFFLINDSATLPTLRGKSPKDFRFVTSSAPAFFYTVLFFFGLCPLLEFGQKCILQILIFNLLTIAYSPQRICPLTFARGLYLNFFFPSYFSFYLWKKHSKIQKLVTHPVRYSHRFRKCGRTDFISDPKYMYLRTRNVNTKQFLLNVQFNLLTFRDWHFFCGLLTRFGRHLADGAFFHGEVWACGSRGCHVKFYNESSFLRTRNFSLKTLRYLNPCQLPLQFHCTTLYYVKNSERYASENDSPQLPSYNT